MATRHITPERLKMYADDVIARDPMPGADGVSARDVREDVGAWLKPTLEELSADEYAPQPYLRFQLQVNAKRRPIDCPALIDRVLMAAVIGALAPTLRPARSVYGVAGRGWQAAVAMIEESLEVEPALYALSFDIQDFFPSVRHEPLLAQLETRLGEDLTALCRTWLETPSIEGSRIIPHRDGVGIPQGASVSSHFAQLYLEPLDEALHAGYPEVKHLRYLDDCLALSTDKEALKRLRAALPELLAPLRLKLNPDKTWIEELSRGGVSYLGHAFPEGRALSLNTERARVRVVGSVKSGLVTELARHAIKRLEADDGLWERGEDEGIDVRELFTLEVARAGRTTRWYQRAQLKRPLRTLYIISTPAQLRIDRGALVIQSKRQEKREIPLSHIGQVVAIGPIELTSAATRYLLSQDVPMLFLSKGGNYFGRLDSATRQREPMLERQFKLKADTERNLEMAGTFVCARLDNARILLSRNNRKERRRLPLVHDVIQDLKRAARATRSATTLDELRGIEGAATRRYWEGFAALLPDHASRRGQAPERPFSGDVWGFKGRNRRPPLDPINSLLSLISVLLTYNVYSIIELSGMSPYVGILHSANRRAPALAFDLIEELRAPIVESLTLKLVGKRLLTLNDFEWRDTSRGPGVFLRHSALRLVLAQFESLMSSERIHPHFGLRGDQRRMIHLQALHLAACTDEGEPYLPFKIR